MTRGQRAVHRGAWLALALVLVLLLLIALADRTGADAFVAPPQPRAGTGR